MTKRGPVDSPKTITKARKSSKDAKEPPAFSFEGQKVAAPGMLIYAETESHTWWMPYKVREEKVVVALGGKASRLITSKTDLIIKGDHVRDDAWEGSNKKRDFEARPDGVELSSFSAYLRANPAVKELVRKHVECTRWEPKDALSKSKKLRDAYKPPGSTSRTSNVLRARHHARLVAEQKARANAEAEAAMDEDYA